MKQASHSVHVFSYLQALLWSCHMCLSCRCTSKICFPCKVCVTKFSLCDRYKKPGMEFKTLTKWSL